MKPSTSRARASKGTKGVPAKKSKLDILDPLLMIPFDVHDLIFQHLTGREVLNLSLVCRLWSEATKGSTKCGDKLMLRFSGFSGYPQITKNGVPPKRKFGGVILTMVNQPKLVGEEIFPEAMPEIINFLKQGNTWKKVKLDSTKIATGEKLDDFMRVIAPTVEHLEIYNLKVSEYEKPGFQKAQENERVVISYPKLKRLRVTKTDIRALEFTHDIANTCRTLESLHFHDVEVSKTFIQKILENSENLSELRLLNYDDQNDHDDGEFDFFSREAAKSHRFHLKSLELNSKAGFKNGDDSFLESQSEYLEELKFPFEVAADTLKIILRMPQLKKLEIPGIEKTDEAWNYVPLTKNTSIEDFECGAFAGIEINIKNKLLSSMPNLTSFSCNYFTKEVLNSLSLHFNKIRRLSIKCWDINRETVDLGNTSYFPNIEKLNCDRISWKQRMPKINFMEGTPFEKLIWGLRAFDGPRKRTFSSPSRRIRKTYRF